MAKPTDEIKKIVEKLSSAVGDINAGSKESVRVNRELLKVISLLNAGFARNEADATDLIDRVKKGLEVTDDVAKKWAKERGATQRDLDDVIFKFRRLERLHTTIVDVAEKYNDTLEDRAELLEDELDFADNLFKTHDDIVKALKKSRDLVDKIGLGTIDVDTVMAKMVKKNVNFNAMFADIFDSVETGTALFDKLRQDSQAMIDSVSGLGGNVQLNFTPDSAELKAALTEMQKSAEIENGVRMAGLLSFFAENEHLQQNMARKFAAELSGNEITFDINTGTIKTKLGELQHGMEGFEDALKNLDQLAVDSNALSQVQNTFLEITDLFAVGVNRTAEQNMQLDKMISKLDLTSQMIVKQHITRQQEISNLATALKYEQERHRLMSRYTSQLIVAENTVRKIGDGVDSISAMLPSGIADMLGLSKLSFTLTEAHRKGVVSFFDEIGKGGTKVQALRGYFKSFGPVLRTAITPVTAMAAGFALLYGILQNITEQYKEIATNLGVSLSQAKQLKEINSQILMTSKNQYVTSEEILAIQKEMIGSSGHMYSNLKKGNAELFVAIGEMGQAFGYGAETATKVHKVFKDLGADDTLSKTLQTNLGLIAEQANLSPSIVAQDLLDASEEMYTYFAGMPEKAARAAIEVRKMGFSLKQAGQIAQKMLDLEGFMTDMYELRAMTGPGGIDFSAAFDKGLMGDIEGMTKEIMTQIGSTAELNQMDYLTRTKIAKTLGMTNEDLSKSVLLHEKMQNLLPDEQAALQANLDKMGDISALGDDQIRQKLDEIKKVDKLNVSWEKIKAVFVKALLPLAESLVGIIDAIAPLLDIVVGLLKTVGSIIKLISPIVRGMLLPFQLIGDVLTVIADKLNTFADGIGEIKVLGMDLTGIFKNSESVLMGIGTIFSSWFILKKFLGIFGMMNSSALSFSLGIGGIGKSFGTVFKGILSGLPLIGSAFKLLFKNVEKQSAKTGAVIETQGKSSFGRIAGMAGGIFAAMNSKLIFGSIQAIGSKVFSKLGIDSAMSVAGIEPAAVDSLGRVQDEGIKTFDVIGMVGSGLMAQYLQYGVEKFIQKKFEKVFESKTDPIVKKASKKFAKIGESFADKMAPATGKVASMFKSLTNYAAQKFPTIAGMLTKGFEKTTPVLDKIKEKITSMFPKKQEEKVTEKVKEKLKDKVTETISEKKVELPTTETKPTLSTPEKKIETPKKQVHTLDKLSQTISKSFNVISTTIKSSLKVVKDAVGGIIDILTTATSKLSKGIGDVIKNLLKGIGDGLSAFKPKALIGAASLVVLSGALWISAKAFQEFAKVQWEDMGKAIVALTGLTGAALLLSSASVQMIMGAVAIGILGAALIPAAYAFKLFNDVEWGSLAKAGLAIVGLGVAAAILGPLLPLMAAGALAIAALGASLIPLGLALNIAAPAMDTFSKSIVYLVKSIGSEGKNLFLTAAGITSLGMALTAFSAMNFSNTISSAIGNLFGEGPLEKIKSLVQMADPLKVVGSAISLIAQSLLIFSDVLQKLDFDKLDLLKEISKLEPSAQLKVSAKTEVEEPEDFERLTPTESLDVKPNFQQSRIRAMEPPRESVAQNVTLRDVRHLSPTVESEKESEVPNFEVMQQSLNTKGLERLMREMIQALHVYSQRPVEVELDGYQVNKVTKKYNNNG